MKGATIKDIAKLSGVSISTVSRVINNNYPVSGDVRRRVEQVMKECDYHPNAIARSLRNNKSHMIALIVPELPNLFFMRAAKGIEREIEKKGYGLAIASSGNSAEKEHAIIDMFIDRRIDGLVVATSDTGGGKLRYCREMGIPVVLIDRNIRDLENCKVLWNNLDGAYRLTRLLLEAGHRRVGIVNGALSSANGSGRLAGFQKAMEEAGLPCREDYISGSNITGEQAYGWVKTALQLPQPPTALFCANSIITDGTLQALEERGLRVGRDVSLVAFGSCDCNAYLKPRITTAEQDCVEMGRQAGRLINQLIDNKRVKDTVLVLDTEIVRGDSVCPPPV